MIDIQTLVLGPLETNCYIVSPPGKNDVVVIDPGDDIAQLTAALAGKNVCGVLITHAHYDHILGLPALKDCPIYVHEDDAPAMTDAMRNMAPADIAQPCVPATHTVKGGDSLSLAGIDFTVLHTPGHTLGGVCYQVGDILFTGDTLFAHGYGRTDLYGGNFSQLMQSLRKLLRMNVHIYPGHGEDAVFSREGNK
ncbi:MAG: MBL fold metallo-hydrolase [Clostridia bacterium]|nr:MBL fold metallo-hydrolase [Clostridia bacterium]